MLKMPEAGMGTCMVWTMVAVMTIAMVGGVIGAIIYPPQKVIRTCEIKRGRYESIFTIKDENTKDENPYCSLSPEHKSEIDRLCCYEYERARNHKLPEKLVINEEKIYIKNSYYKEINDYINQVNKLKNNNADYIKRLYEEQSKYLQSLMNELNLNFIAHSFLILTSFYVLWGKEKLTIPFLNIPIKVIYMRIIVPLVLLYYWLRFGFLLDGVLDTRFSLMKIIILDELINNLDINHYYSNLNTLRDRGMIDGWFELFPYSCKAYQVADTFVPMTNFDIGTEGDIISYIPIYLIMFLYGVFYGIAHAYALFVPSYGPRKGPWGLGLLRTILPYGILVIILMSHGLFYFYGVHPNWLQVVIGIVAILFTFFLYKIVAKRLPVTPEN
jgi:hypothetical protein